jgi:hypothetical protein
MPFQSGLYSAGHYAIDVRHEIQGGLHLQLTTSSDTLDLDGATVQILLSEQRLANSTRVRVPMRTGATFNDSWTFSVDGGNSGSSSGRGGGSNAGQVTIPMEHHEYLVWRFGELIFRDKHGGPLDIAATEVDVSAWTVNYLWDEKRAAVMQSSSADLDAVFRLNQYSLKALTLDLYADSNARQRSCDCQADAAMAILCQYAASSELGLPGLMTEQIMSFAPGEWALRCTKCQDSYRTRR